MTTVARPRPARLEKILTDDYLRQRSDPRPEDPYYLHLIDLLDALRGALTGANGCWLDYGSNNSPYADLLRDAAVETADVRDVPGLTYLIPEGGRCPAGDDAFDGILSTQVLEHVPDVRECLRDCLRMLRPGGKLVLSTHGIWEDHGCPGDYWRWTADGLRLALTEAGFAVERVSKLTAEMRALFQLAQTRKDRFLGPGRSTPLGTALFYVGRALQNHQGALNRFADRRFGRDRAVDGPGAWLYLGLLAVARKPDAR